MRSQGDPFERLISTVAGIGGYGFSGDGDLATTATFEHPLGLAVDSSGNIYITDGGNVRIRKVTVSTGKISTVAGNGSFGYGGDGGQATATPLDVPASVAVDSSGNIYIADEYNNRIRRVTTAGVISTVAGNGTEGYAGDGGAATAAMLDHPDGVAIDASGNLLISDYNNNRIRRVSLSSQTITTVAGGVGDGGQATAATMRYPYGVGTDSNGNVYFTDQ